MSVAFTTVLTKLNILIDDNISGTTSSDGNISKTTFIDSALKKYPDGHFGDPQRDPEWWAYVSTTLRPIKNFDGKTGTILVHNAFSAKVLESVAYSIHKYDRDKKKEAINQALYQAYPWFYKRVEDDDSLTGQGGSDTEYEVPAEFVDFPDQIWQKNASSDNISWTEVVNYQRKEVEGTKYFYASIPTGYTIYLIGKTYLTPFTTDVSTTELTSGQAEVVALKAAANLYWRMANTVDANDAGRYEAIANRFEGLWDREKIKHRMELLCTRTMNFGWLNG